MLLTWFSVAYEEQMLTVAKKKCTEIEVMPFKQSNSVQFLKQKSY